jgi:DNA ligase D
MHRVSGGETLDGVAFTNLDEPLFPEAGTTKRDLVEYLTAVADRILPDLEDRPLSVVRVLRGQTPFMQKNVPTYAPSWLRTVRVWAESSKRDVSYALCNDRRSLLWFANQRAVEYHPALVRADRLDAPMYLVLDLDPPTADGFRAAVHVARLVRRTLSEAGLVGAAKTSGAKGLHVFVPISGAAFEEVAAAGRALAARVARLDPDVATTAFVKEERHGKVFVDSTRVGWATVVAAYSPRARPGLPVSFPVDWDDLDRVSPDELTIHTAPRLIAAHDPWGEAMPSTQRVSAELVEEGRTIPVARVQAMHAGLRRARARRAEASGG